jgi:NitT/TauT family transport system permease protein
MTSTIREPELALRSKIEKFLAAVLALAVWQAAAMLIGNRLLLVAPTTVLLRLFELCFTAGFWRAVGFSSLRIVCGFALGLLFGVCLALIAGSFRVFRVLLSPYVTAIKAVPVASFIILCLIWIKARNLAVVICFLMVFPVVYTNVLQGIDSVGEDMREMCRVFRVGRLRQVVYVWLPQIKPYLLSACGVASGMAWKAGAAAEVIGIPSGSIGEKLYQAKIYLSTGDLFAWTLVIVLLSVVFEKLVAALVNLLYKSMEGC